MHSGSWVVTCWFTLEKMDMPGFWGRSGRLNGAPQTSSGHRLTPQLIWWILCNHPISKQAGIYEVQKWQSNPQFRSLTTNIPRNDVVPVCNTVTSTWNAFVHSFKLNQSFGYFSLHHAIKIWWSDASFDLRSCHHHHQPVSVWLRSKRPCIDPGKLPHSSLYRFSNEASQAFGHIWSYLDACQAAASHTWILVLRWISNTSIYIDSSNSPARPRSVSKRPASPSRHPGVHFKWSHICNQKTQKLKRHEKPREHSRSPHWGQYRCVPWTGVQ